MGWKLIKDWVQRPGVHASAPDPYLIWADLTRWADLRPPTESRGAGSTDFPVRLIIELEQGATLREFRAAFKGVGGASGLISKAYRRSRFLTASLPLSHLKVLADPDGKTAALIKRFDICLPVIPGRPALSLPEGKRSHRRQRPQLGGDILMGVVDTGCPFAHHGLTRGTGTALSTRIAALWDMNRESPLFAQAKRSTVPDRMGFGAEVLREGENGIDTWLAEFTRPSGDTDEAACYAGANDRALGAHESHGAHVLSVLAGPVPVSHRICQDVDVPPDWNSKTMGDAASDPQRTDLAFVQLPRACLQDSSGSWLSSHMLDAVRYLVDCADAKKTKHVVLSISYGCTVGPHDGSSILEQAFDEIVKDSRSEGPSVDIVLAAGNSFAAAGHAILRREHTDARAPAPLVWRVPPDAEAPSFLQLWFPAGADLAGVVVSVTPPNAPPLRLKADKVAVYPTLHDPTITAVFLKRSSRGADSPMLLLAVEPTASVDGDRRAVAPHGDWRIEVAYSKLGPNQEIHAYIARNDQETGTPRRGRQSYFVDAHEPLRHLRSCDDDPGMVDTDEIERDVDRRDALVRRRGTLNGIATGARTIAVAGYELRRGAHAPYSSAGRNDSPIRGVGPTSACVTDEASALPGIRAAGNLGSSTFRLVGTSTAPPQWARILVNAYAALQATTSPPEGHGAARGDSASAPDPETLVQEFVAGAIKGRRAYRVAPENAVHSLAAADPKSADDLWGAGKLPLLPSG